MNQKLSEEAVFIYKKLFDANPDSSIIEWYIKANSHFELSESKLLSDIILKNQDLEAIEYKLRLKNPHNIITRKIHIILYLAETKPQNYNIFINTKNKGFVMVSLSLFFSGIMSILKIIKGFLLYRNKNV